VRLGFSNASWSPGALWGKAMSGQGFEGPRKVGLIMLGLAAAFIAGNVLMVKIAHIYYRFLYAGGAVCLLAGLFLLVTGQPKAKPDGTPVSGGARFGFITSIVIGIGLGVFLNVYYWEHWVLRTPDPPG
jgi:hypothetical protein